MLKSSYRSNLIPLGDILYIEAMDNYVKVHLTEGRYQMSQVTLSWIISQLPKEQFLRIHKSFVVACCHIESYTRQQVFIRGTSHALPIGRTFLSILREKFG